MSVLVEFDGLVLRYLGDSVSDPDHALAPLDHCDQDGEVLRDKVFENSYAYVYSDGTIMRYGKQVGKISDLVLVRPLELPL